MLIKFAIEDLVEDREYNNSKQSNIRNIKYNLYAFHDFCVDEGVANIEEVTYQHIKKYMLNRKREGDKPSTLNTRTQRIKSLFNYCVESGYIDKSPASKVKRTLHDTKIEVFTDEQIHQMLGYYRRLKQRDKRMYSIRDYTLILFFISTGFRRSEVCNLKWSDVDLDNRTIKVLGKNRIQENFVITEKLTKELIVFKRFIERYFDYKTVDYVFPDRRGNQLSSNAMSLIFKALSKKMNFEDVRVSPHTLRHTYCHRLISSGANAFTVQKLMRHKNIVTTMNYVNLWSEHLREENEKHNPLNNLDI